MFIFYVLYDIDYYGLCFLFLFRGMVFKWDWLVLVLYDSCEFDSVYNMEGDKKNMSM